MSDVELKVQFQITTQDGVVTRGSTMEIASFEGEADKVIINGAAIIWDRVAGICVTRVPVVMTRTPILPAAG